MNARFWLAQLPSTDPAFAPLQRASWLSPEEDWPLLSLAHHRAVQEATWGAGLDLMESRALEYRALGAEAALRAKETEDRGDAAAAHSAGLEALGYALGLTAVRVAIRAREQAPAGVAA